MGAWYLTKHDLCVNTCNGNNDHDFYPLTMEVQLKMATTNLEFDKQMPGSSRAETVPTLISSMVVERNCVEPVP